MMIFAPHKIKKDSPKYLEVKAYMQQHGKPTIRVVDCGDYYGAIEGSHRLAAAHDLGCGVDVVIVSESQSVESDLQDVASNDDGTTSVKKIAEYLSWDSVSYNFDMD